MLALAANYLTAGVPITFPNAPVSVFRVTSELHDEIPASYGMTWTDCAYFRNTSSIAATREQVTFAMADRDGHHKRRNLTVDVRAHIEPGDDLAEGSCHGYGYANGTQGNWLISSSVYAHEHPTDR